MLKNCFLPIFEFEEFIQHFKNVHLEIKDESRTSKPATSKWELEEEGNERIIKLEITKNVHQNATESNADYPTHTKDVEECIWSMDNSVDSDEDYDFEANSEDDGLHEGVEVQGKSLLTKTRKPKEYSCEICSKKYADSRRLKVHVALVHLREKPFKCSQCDETCAEERYLKNHIRCHHTGFECPECHKRFKTNPSLKRHLLIHVKKKDFICNEKNCGKDFPTQGRLREHQRYHNSEMFICEECGYKCRKRESLVVHKRHHTGEKPFGCKLCERRFGSKELLNEHMASHETVRKHICDVCGKSFNRPKALYHHKHLHLGVKKFVCKICGQAYAQAAGLSAHMRKHRENVNSFTNLSKMLKSCFLPTLYTNFTNKTCGEIVCQTETTFTIICKICDIKIFDYNEFIKHFRTTHWPEICKDKTGSKQSSKNNPTYDVDSLEKIIKTENETDVDEIKTEFNVEQLAIVNNKSNEELMCNDSEKEDAVCSMEFDNQDSDSEEMSKPLVILKKATTKNETSKEKRFECAQCKRKFTTKFYLRFHIRQQHEPKNFQCDKCDKSFVEKRYLTQHQRSHIGYTCQICHKVFDKYEALRYHAESHIESKNFICDYETCGKAFPSKRRLSAHKRSHFVRLSHLLTANYVCEVCGSGQRDKNALISHKRSHTGEKPFACTICDRRFMTKSLLLEHKACHETERKHVCEVCGKSFNRPKALYHHKHLHLGVKKFVCKLCGAAYAQGAGLSAHMRKHKENKIITDKQIRKMLKTCFLPTSYTNFTNKTCGEIVCQTETTFTIICKICDIKIFDYNEFIKHFRTTHWPEICKDKTGSKQSTKNNPTYDVDNLEKIIKTEHETDVDEIKTEFNVEQLAIVNNKSNEELMCNDSEKEDTVSGMEFDNQDSDSEEMSKPLVILKKATAKNENSKEKRFECAQCKRKFTTKFYLRFHIRQQHEPKNFQCDKCNKSFVEKRYLTLHQRSHIGYTCQICHKVFDKYEALRYHGESHIESRNFICDYETCGKAFPNNRRLSAHKRSHFAQPSFVCEICGSRQRSKEFLIVHIRTHTGEKPYACNQCDRRFASKHFLQDHQAVHATERSHVCTVCGKAFASSKSLYHHRHLHSDIKKYVCKICNSAYSQAAGLSAHMRKHKQDSGLLDTEETMVGESNTFS
ncbi:zinc finger protein 62-like [Calliphora vicina]|uniref:zinc finger protein 62-like n=1 Tax=Calliphora vicina TaxID=7373 RepID=UPI00325B6C13